MSVSSPAGLRLCVVAALAGLQHLPPAQAAEFSVTPIRVDLRPGRLSDTITVANHASGPLRVAVKLQEWTQDANGADLYQDSSDLVYFPRELEIAPGSKRLVRVGATAPAGATERTYRLFIEEDLDPGAGGERPQVAFSFRFGVPIFLAPAVPHPQPQLGEPVLAAGKVSVVMKNTGNAHFRLTRVGITDASSFSTDIAGWYSLAGSTRSYTLEVPRDVCLKARTLNLWMEGEDIRIDRKVDVDPASCG